MTDKTKNENFQGIERRDYENNKQGRRFYDSSFCPFFDPEKFECRKYEEMKKELDKKLPSWVFRTFAAGMVTLTGILLAMAWNAVDNLNHDQKILFNKLSENIHSVRESVVEVKTNQKILMEDLGIRRGKH